MDELVKALREAHEHAMEWGKKPFRYAALYKKAADAIEELQTTLCNWCAVCPRDKRDLSTCEIYESCRANPPKGEK